MVVRFDQDLSEGSLLLFYVAIESAVLYAVTTAITHPDWGCFFAGIPLGIVPRGTANAFSVALGIPTHIDDPTGFQDAAADVILQVKP